MVKYRWMGKIRLKSNIDKEGEGHMSTELIGRELDKFLSERSGTRYLSVLNNLRNIGSRRLAVTDMRGLSIGSDLAVVTTYNFGGCDLYLEVSDADNLPEFHAALIGTLRGAKEYMLSSDRRELFDDPGFVGLFGSHEVAEYEQYGMLKPCKAIGCGHIRRLTVGDEELILAVAEPTAKYRMNLKRADEIFIKPDNPLCAVYGYLGDGGISGYLIADSFDGGYWDIAYVYVSESERGRGIATSLAAYYANDIASAGGFASYGTPENEMSKRAAIKAGFECFERRWCTSWIKNIETT